MYWKGWSHKMDTIRSPDLYPLGFFLWKYAKNNIYKSPVCYLGELKMKIADEIENISRQALSHVFSHLVKRMHSYISVEGEHVAIGFIWQ